ncbi:hypothetical protein [Rhizobium sp. RU36D]|uniref:hypothetical protein n=1 Tax=Rhizobium sp. RU36D TaxID=1907415 RepID=UPI0009D86186|nr:hypothetical protein [Rhizobium sp. RU36D]SMD11020.1 hypothetical protein SAMN05880593_12255 [Rhizobium sp. RU36D]
MTLTVDDLVGSPKFIPALQLLASEMRNRYDGNPRLSRLLASHQRWMLTQAAFALHIEYDPNLPSSGLTTTRLKDIILSVDAASRNTVLNYLDQLQTYRFLRIAGEPGRRPRRFEATDVSVNAMFGWVAVNLAALDQIDNGDRCPYFIANPGMFRLLQPRIAYRCIDDVRWREPPARVALFLWTEAGGLVMDELVIRVSPDAVYKDRIDIGRIDARQMANDFMMSRTHLQRLLRKAMDQGSLVWQDSERKSDMWLTGDYLHEYCGWQAVKFAIVDDSFEWAKREYSPSALPMERLSSRTA